MKNLINQFLVVLLYAMLFAFTYASVCGLIALTFWISYIDVASYPASILILMVSVITVVTINLAKLKI